jgi:hypothetical protein
MTLVLELKSDVAERLRKQAEEQGLPVEAVAESILASSRDVYPSTPEEFAERRQVLDELMNFGARHGISGTGFDVTAAKHEGHRY